MRRLLAVLALVAVAATAAVWIFRPDRAIAVGTASTSLTLCGDIFVTGLPAGRAFAEDILPQRGMRMLLKRLRYTVEPSRRQVRTTWAGHFARTATFHPGYGCSLELGAGPAAGTGAAAQAHPDATAAAGAGTPPMPPPETPVTTGGPALQAALARAFAEPAAPPYRRVRAIVVMRDDAVVAERYAPGIGAGTPLLGYSVSKSVINALVGILVRQGRLRVDAAAPVAAWRAADDPRHAITLDQLLRMTSGLQLEERDDGFDPVSRMLFCEPDMAAFAASARMKEPPGRTWEYTSGNTLIVAGLVRDAVGGHAADVLRFARRELFAPAGMQHVVMEFDAAGTPVGSTRIFASARDWARFGDIYLRQGLAGGRQILPAGWVAWSARPTLDSPYGAGFWINGGRSADARGRVRAGMPADAFFASGNLGQRVVIVPSQHLVVVRLGATVDPPDFDISGLIRLVADVMAAGR